MRKRLSDKFRTALLYLRCSRAFPNRQISRGGRKTRRTASRRLPRYAAPRQEGPAETGSPTGSAVPRTGRERRAAPHRSAQTQQTHRRAGGNARWRDSGHRKTSVLRMTSGSNVLRREYPPEAAAGKRRRTTPSAPGRMTRGTNAGGAEPHGGSRTDTGDCGGKVRRKPRPANGAAQPHPHRDA